MKRATACELIPVGLGALSLLMGLTALPTRSGAQQSTGAGMQSRLAPSGTRSVAWETAVDRKTTVTDFGWLAGRWQGTWGPRVAQQVWMAPRAGVMMGTFQLTENDSTLVLELFTLVEESDGLKFRIRHFSPSLLAWEKPGPIVLTLISADAKTMIFDNSSGGQPKRAVITRTDPDTYISRSEIEPEKGDTQVTEITYHRQKEGLPVHHH